MAKAELQPNQIQDLADAMGEIKKVAAGLDLRFLLRVELGGHDQPPAEVVRKLNAILSAVSDGLKLR